jgi:hypothetical protein
MYKTSKLRIILWLQAKEVVVNVQAFQGIIIDGSKNLYYISGNIS